LIGKLPATLASRSVWVELQRLKSGEAVEPLRFDQLSGFDPIRQRARRWACDNTQAVATQDPAMPDGVHGRMADNWRPLLAIAEIAGGHWPQLARQAIAVSAGRAAEDTETTSVMLLEDIRTLFAGTNRDRMSSHEILHALVQMEERPWREIRRGASLTPHGLTKMLKPFGIASNTIRIENGTAKGYKKDQFADAWARYL